MKMVEKKEGPKPIAVELAKKQKEISISRLSSALEKHQNRNTKRGDYSKKKTYSIKI